MPSNPHRPGSSAATSFAEREVAWLGQVLAVLRRGADPSILARAPECRSVARKVQVMKASLARQRRGT